MAGARHEIRVREILRAVAGAQRKGFLSKMRAAVAGGSCDEGCLHPTCTGTGHMAGIVDEDAHCCRCYVRSEFRMTYHLVPDAFVIDDENRTITVYEVEVTSMLLDAKLRQYARLWWDCDCEEWDFVLVSVDRLGAETHIDLCDWWYQFDSLDRERARA